MLLLLPPLLFLFHGDDSRCHLHEQISEEEEEEEEDDDDA